MRMSDDKIELKPCPFCGSKRIESRFFLSRHIYEAYCECQKCSSRGRMFHCEECFENDEDKRAVRWSIEAWNKRNL